MPEGPSNFYWFENKLYYRENVWSFDIGTEILSYVPKKKKHKRSKKK